MKLHFFTFRKPSTENEKEQPIVRLSNCSSDDGVRSLDNTKTGFFLFRMIRHGRRSKNGNKKSSMKNATPTASHTSSNPTTISSTKKKINVTTSNREHDLPLSYIRIVPRELSEVDLMQKTTSMHLMQKHGLNRDDSILSYFKQVDDAYNEIMVVVDDSPHSSNTVYDVDNDNRAEVYKEQDAFDQSISMITMDPALTYNHSIILDEHSWRSFITLYESERYDNDDDEEPADGKATPIRYLDI
jgi:hypothetical protein